MSKGTIIVSASAQTDDGAGARLTEGALRGRSGKTALSLEKKRLPPVGRSRQQEDWL